MHIRHTQPAKVPKYKRVCLVDSQRLLAGRPVRANRNGSCSVTAADMKSFDTSPLTLSKRRVATRYPKRYLCHAAHLRHLRRTRRARGARRARNARGAPRTAAAARLR